MMPLNSKSSQSGKIDPKSLHKSYLEKMEDDLKEKGVVFFDEHNLNIDNEYLTLPADITEISSKELGAYLNAFTQQKVYLRTILGRAEIQTEEYRRTYLEASESLYRKYSLDKLTETAKDRIINSNEKVKPAYNNYMDYKKKQDIVEYSISNIEDIIFLISREVTRRTGDFNEDNRNYNVSKR